MLEGDDPLGWPISRCSSPRARTRERLFVRAPRPARVVNEYGAVGLPDRSFPKCRYSAPRTSGGLVPALSCARDSCCAQQALRGECASRGAASGPVEVSESSQVISFRIESDNGRCECVTSLTVAPWHRHTGD